MPDIFVAGVFDNNQIGYGVHASDFLAAMRRTSRFPVREVCLSGRPRTPLEVAPARPSPGDALIIVGNAQCATLFRNTRCRKACFGLWESTRLPDTWHDALSTVDEVWTASAWGADVLRENGIDPHKVHVVPEGVDGDLFRPAGDKLAFLDEVKGFKLLHVGKAEPRKGTVELLQAFDRAFAAEQPVHLVIACHNRLIPGFDTVRFIENLCLQRRRLIVPIQPLPSRQSMAALYRSCDAFVAPSKAEGWGLPALEAMASGLPVALTHYSGHAAFANADNSLAIPFAMAPIEPGALPHFARADGDYGEWAVPDIDGLAEAMRTMHRDRDRLRARARRAAQDTSRKWSWDAAAATACRRIDALLGHGSVEAV